MFTKILFATALAAVMASPAHADLKWNGPVLQGISLNGISLQGISLNGVKPNEVGLNVGGHQGVGLNGQVIAIEF